MDSGFNATRRQKSTENQSIMQPLIYKQCPTRLSNGDFAEILYLQGGPVVVLSHGGIASYKSADAVSDPLGNGLLGTAELPDDRELEAKEDSFVAHIRSGFVQLHNDYALLVTPFHATLFASNSDALEGKDRLAQVPLDAIDLV